jgi:hypothetical protein
MYGSTPHGLLHAIWNISHATLIIIQAGSQNDWWDGTIARKPMGAAMLRYEAAWFGVANIIAESDGVRDLEMYLVSTTPSTPL